MLFGVQQEYFERCFPSPSEWSFGTRQRYRSFRWYEENDAPPNWLRIANVYRELLERLEDPKADGAGLKEQESGSILGKEVEKTGYDVTSMSAQWIQGYHDLLMSIARAAEHLDEWVVDETRNKAYPANTIIGPSNPNRQPIHPTLAPPPREENCKIAFGAPEPYYTQILTTKGFTPKQRLDAALAYASWLEYKGTPSAASEMYKWALDTAISSSPYADNPSEVVDPKTHVLKAESGSHSITLNSNILRATTAMAVYHARSGSTSTALPIFLSILRARRSLPDEPKTMRSTLIPDEAPPSGPLHNVRNFVEGTLRTILVAPSFPLDTDNGTDVPIRDPKNKCEEAAIMVYIGEILYASSSGLTGKSVIAARENGLAWTREAVDIAEENMRGRLSKSNNKEGKKVCTECLKTGLDNWGQMVSILAGEEHEKAEKEREKPRSWFGGGNDVEMIGRWERESAVVNDRRRRAKDILGEKDENEEEAVFVQPRIFGGLTRGWLGPS